jgi:peptidoglycan-N-acetylglucosamine deacetylase
MNTEPQFCDDRVRHTTAPLTPNTYAPFLDFDENARDAAEIALTFDDGPDGEGYTGQVLDTLRSTGVPATFFINTKNAIDVDKTSTGRALVQRMANEGHQVGNHTVHHKDLGSASTNASTELNGVLATLRTIAPTTLSTRLWRAPYGNPWFGPQSRLNTLAPTFAKTGVHIGWNIDSLDWDCGSSQCVIDNVLAKVDAGKSGIVLLHSINSATATASPGS